MELQEIFDTVVTALRKQGCKSIYNPEETGTLPIPYGTSCLYRQDGTATCKIKCAAGHLIPDEVYHSKMEGQKANFILDKKGKPIFSLHLSFINELQRVHDYIPISEWENSWKRIAINYDLIYSPPS